MCRSLPIRRSRLEPLPGWQAPFKAWRHAACKGGVSQKRPKFRFRPPFSLCFQGSKISRRNPDSFPRPPPADPLKGERLGPGPVARGRRWHPPPPPLKGPAPPARIGAAEGYLRGGWGCPGGPVGRPGPCPYLQRKPGICTNVRTMAEPGCCRVAPARGEGGLAQIISPSNM